MKITDFSVERYFARYEFTAKYMLSSSDCDGFAMRDVLAMASPEELGQWDNLRLGYTETVGSESLRIAIRQHYRTIGMNEIVVSSPGEAN
ncbi:MAG: aminotransferase, partial [Bacteroidota bacterium]